MSGEQGNKKSLKLKGTGEQRQFWGIQILRFWGTRENAYFLQEYKGTVTQPWEGLINIDEPLPCVCACSTNIFGFSLVPQTQNSPKLPLISCSLLFLDNVFFCPPEINDIIPLFHGRVSSI